MEPCKFWDVEYGQAFILNDALYLKVYVKAGCGSAGLHLASMEAGKIEGDTVVQPIDLTITTEKGEYSLWRKQ